MSTVPDVDRALVAFLGQFNAVYSKSYYMGTDVKCFLFRPYIEFFYGAETW